MKEHPILFTGPMVRAILEGRKTQTRRPIKAPKGLTIGRHDSGLVAFDDEGGPARVGIKRPFAVGDRLWVREGVWLRKCDKSPGSVWYATDGKPIGPNEYLNAADYGAPTARKRLFMVARCDGNPIVWPEATHGAGRTPYRTAAECIDWTIPTKSIFGRKKSLAEKTLRRIAEGIRRYVVGTPTPYLVNVPEGLAIPTLVQTGYGEREGQAPRCLNIHAPLGTVVSSVKHGLVAFIERFQLGAFPGRSDQVAAFLTKFYGTSTGAQMDLPMPTVTATGHHLGIVTVHGEAYRIVDIGMRMLEPRELATAQGFRADYILTGNKTQQVARIGNSVCPPIAAAIVRANRLALAGAA